MEKILALKIFNSLAASFKVSLIQTVKISCFYVGCQMCGSAPSEPARSDICQDQAPISFPTKRVCLHIESV